MGIGIEPPLYTRTCPPLFFEPTPPGTTPGPRPPGRVPCSVSSGGVNTIPWHKKPMLRGEVGARVRVIRACGHIGFKSGVDNYVWTSVLVGMDLHAANW